MKTARRLALLGLAATITACCDLTGVDEGATEMVLAGCLGATGSVGFDQLPPPVPSVAPWLADYPGLGATIDQQLTGVVGHVAGSFAVAPAVRYYDDAGHPNAFATPVLTEGAPDGTVRIGVVLVSSEIRRFVQTDYGQRAYTYGVTAVVAHEMAHVAQMKRGAGASGPATELQADFLAGWYFARLAATDPNFALNAGLRDGMNAFFSRGDYFFNLPQHHGTPEQRLAAFLAGYNVGPVGVEQAWSAATGFRQQIGG